MPHLNTVLGTLHPEEMGVTAVCEHILRGPPGWAFDPGAWFKMGKVFEKCYNDLMDFKLLGGQTWVDCSGIGAGRELDVTIKLSAATGVHVVGSTGFLSGALMAPHFSAHSGDAGAEYFASLFAHEIETGMGRTRVKAGVISVGCGAAGMTPLEEAQFRGAARAAKKTGVAVITHGAQSADRQLDLLRGEGLDPGRVIFGGCDEHVDFERDRRIAKSGACVAYDNVGLEQWSRMPHAMPDASRAEMVKRMIDAGHRGQVMISAGSRGWTLGQGESHLGNIGNVFRYFVPRLKDAGVGDESIHAIFVDNPKRVLPIR